MRNQEILLAAAIVIVIVAGFAAFILYQRKKSLQQLKAKLADDYGKLASRIHTEEQFKVISYYDQRKREEEPDKPFLDDITWNDLDMNAVFDLLDVTYSSPGEEQLYHILRTPETKPDELERRERLIEWNRANDEKRRDLQVTFASLGKTYRLSRYSYIRQMIETKPSIDWVSYLPIALFCVALISAFLNPEAGVAALVIVLFVNLFLYLGRAKKINDYLNAISFIKRLAENAAKASVILNELPEYSEALTKYAKTIRRGLRGSGLISKGAQNGSLEEILLDYLRMVTHIDLIVFNRIIRELYKGADDLLGLYDLIGFLEAMTATASFRSADLTWCRPELTDTGRVGKASLEFMDAYHLMIEKPVPNSFKVSGGALFTGSNASGKSTFLKTAAICAVLAQSIITVPASSYRASYFRIYTSMALRDDLRQKESYYIVEIKSLKRILEGLDEDTPTLCLIDEVLRGTNTIERIAASAQILRGIGQSRAVCLAATHDIELTRMLENIYDNYHFQEEIEEGDIHFDYHLYKGRAKSRNAIRLLSVIGYSDEIIDKANTSARRFEETGIWSL